MAEGKRIKKIDTRFTEKEYEVIEALEKELGISKTDLVRMRILTDAPAILINAKELISHLNNLGTELGRSGNNINQLAKYGNALIKKGRLSPIVIERFTSLMETYHKQQLELQALFRKIVKLLTR